MNKDDHAKVIRSDFNEITDSGIINQLKQKLKSHKFCILTNRSHIDIDESFMRKFVIGIKELVFKAKDSNTNSTQIYTSNINSNDIDIIFSALCSSNIKVCFVCLLLILHRNTICLLCNLVKVNHKV